MIREIEDILIDEIPHYMTGINSSLFPLQFFIFFAALECVFVQCLLHNIQVYINVNIQILDVPNNPHSFRTDIPRISFDDPHLCLLLRFYVFIVLIVFSVLSVHFLLCVHFRLVLLFYEHICSFAGFISGKLHVIPLFISSHFSTTYPS